MTEGPTGPLILTAQLDPMSQARFDRERRLYFPPSLNFVPAHVTLFHHLPPEKADEVGLALATACAASPPCPFTMQNVRFLGRGCAYALSMPAVADLRSRLAARWKPWLTAQDNQPWRAHVTIQNKVPAKAAKQLHDRLIAGFTPQQGQVLGVLCWEYLAGPWRLLQTYGFDGAAP